MRKMPLFSILLLLAVILGPHAVEIKIFSRYLEHRFSAYC